MILLGTPDTNRNGLRTLNALRAFTSNPLFKYSSNTIDANLLKTKKKKMKKKATHKKAEMWKIREWGSVNLIMGVKNRWNDVMIKYNLNKKKFNINLNIS